MANYTPDQNAAWVERAAKKYADAASSSRPLEQVEGELLKTVGVLIGATVKRVPGDVRTK